MVSELKKKTDYEDSVATIRHALSEEGRPLSQFAKEFRLVHGI